MFIAFIFAKGIAGSTTSTVTTHLLAEQDRYLDSLENPSLE